MSTVISAHIRRKNIYLISNVHSMNMSASFLTYLQILRENAARWDITVEDDRIYRFKRSGMPYVYCIFKLPIWLHPCDPKKEKPIWKLAITRVPLTRVHTWFWKSINRMTEIHDKPNISWAVRWIFFGMFGDIKEFPIYKNRIRNRLRYLPINDRVRKQVEWRLINASRE